MSKPRSGDGTPAILTDTFLSMFPFISDAHKEPRKIMAMAKMGDWTMAMVVAVVMASARGPRFHISRDQVPQMGNGVLYS